MKAPGADAPGAFCRLLSEGCSEEAAWRESGFLDGGSAYGVVFKSHGPDVGR